MRALMLVVLAGCWRGGEVPKSVVIDEEPHVSFVARVEGIAKLEHDSETLQAKLSSVSRRILRLGTEAERAAIKDDLVALTDLRAQLVTTVHALRKRGDHPEVLDKVDHTLADAVVTLERLGEGLSYANTLADLQEIDNRRAERFPLGVHGRISVDDFDLP